MTKKVKLISRLIAVTIAAACLLTVLPVAFFKASGEKTDRHSEKKAAYLGNEERDKLLVESGLGEEEVERLKKEGYSETEITNAKLFVERIVFQLNEIVTAAQNRLMQPDAQITLSPLNISASNTSTVPQQPGKTDDDNAVYKDIMDKFSVKLAVTLMLKLKDDIGSVEQVMDEYLYSLQTGLDMEEYITNKAAYQKKREESSANFNHLNVITIQKIEEKVLEIIQNSNKANMTTKDDSLMSGTTGNKQNGSASVKASIPDTITDNVIPDNGIKTVRPENPADKLMNEINDINPNRN